MATDDSTSRLDTARDLVRRATQVAKKAVAEATGDGALRIPGVPAPEPPAFEEPTEPREPLPPAADQHGPEPRTAGGTLSGDAAHHHQQGAHLTTAQGLRLRDSDHSLKAGERGPTLLQDHHLREKISHFDHERIPERVVHARGAAAHGVFVGYGTTDEVSTAGLFSEGKQTPVFVRFSTVLGSRGSADTVRDTRGFATKFYTDEGTWDLIGNNMPVFFIQDGIKFPDIVHAAKPHPDREIPQAQSAHDTFWDFVSLHTEAQHHTMWNMSDRGIPRSFRTMEGFGVHTFRTTNAEGQTSLVKFHWKPVLGVHSLVWEEAQMLCGFDPDFHRRDLADAIESGAHPEWELGIQVFEDTADQTFAGIDLLDATKLVPEELAPVQPIGLLTLNANPGNYFEETEQVAFNLGNFVPGIDATDDPLLQARLFSYSDTQLTRLGGPNWQQIPINRPHAPVNDMLREGFHQDGSHTGIAPYRPNSLDGGCPFQAGGAEHAFLEAPARVTAAPKVRAQPASYADHTSQPRMFYRSLSTTEQQHLVAAYTFELGKCYEQTIKERQLGVLAQIDTDLAARVAVGLGLPAPSASGATTADVEPSPALSQLGATWPADGRIVGVVVDDNAELDTVRAIRQQLHDAHVTPFLIAPIGGRLAEDLPIQRSFDTARSVELDAVLVASSPPPQGPTNTQLDPRLVLLVQEAWRHCKPIAAWGEGATAVETALAPVAAATSADDLPGVLFGDADGVPELGEALLGLLGSHRVWDRFPPAV